MNINNCFYRPCLVASIIIVIVTIFIQNKQLFSQDNNLTPQFTRLSSEDLLARELYIYTRRAGGPGMVIPENAYSNAIHQMSLLPKD